MNLWETLNYLVGKTVDPNPSIKPYLGCILVDYEEEARFSGIVERIEENGEFDSNKDVVDVCIAARKQWRTKTGG